jgi:uncharacterized LabA/DUF88 family protein
MSKKNRANNYAFIDSQNLNLSIRNQGWILDYKRFRRYLDQKYNISQAFLFIGYVPSNQNLYTSLQKYGYLLIFKPTLILPGGKTKGNFDAELVLHSVIEMQNYNKAIIISGDGDYHCLVEYLIKQDKLLRLMIPNRYKYSSLLKKFAEKIVFMNNLKGKLEHKKR